VEQFSSDFGRAWPIAGEREQAALGGQLRTETQVSLTTGTQLGPYEIVNTLGSGGMGEVYRARDTRLDRSVAIKILPPHLGERPELKERFEREARAVSALNHPNICTLYDIGHQDGIDFIVLELLEGENLAQRLSRGPLSIEEALRYSTEIADALDKAHRHGVVHRDLKPGNLMITKSGSKLLDFGLAKISAPSVFRPVSGDERAPGSGSHAEGLTSQGALLGTLHYMAPEQLEGRDADPRSDVFSLGVLIYEMVSGQKAFQGKSQASVVAAILDRQPPPLTSIQPSTPASLERVIRRCLEKDPDERWQSAKDLAGELKWIAEAEAAPKPAVEKLPETPATPLPAARQREWAAWVLATVLFLSTIVFALLYLRRPEPSIPTVRFAVATPDTSAPSHIALSPDGRHLVYVGRTPEGSQALRLRPLDSTTESILRGTESALHPFWSPDSRSVGFFASGTLKIIDINGGSAQTITNVSGGAGGTWNADGVIVFTDGAVLHRVSVDGRASQVISSLDHNTHETAQLGPHFLPDGRHLIYLSRNADATKSGINVRTLDSGESKQLVRTNSVAAFAPPGYLLYLNDDEVLMARPFDANGITFKGDAMPLLPDRIAINTLINRPGFSTSANGLMAYRTAANPSRRLTWFDRSGKKIGSAGPAGIYAELSISPDEKTIAVEKTVSTTKSDIWLIDAASGGMTKFTFGDSLNGSPLWFPDSRQILFNAGPPGRLDIYSKEANGAGQEKLFYHSPAGSIAYPEDLSPDGKMLILRMVDSVGNADLWTLPAGGDQKATPYLATKTNEIDGQISPDGRWLAYASNETGRYEVYVQSFPNPGGKRQVSTSGGHQPRWRHDGKELFYLALDSNITVVSVKGDASLETSAPQSLFEVRFPRASIPSAVGRTQYYVSPDGQRFLVNMSEETVDPITTIVNWPSLLKKQ
jgi:serine/threonine protein kinase